MKFLHFADAHIDAVQIGKWDLKTGYPIRIMDFLYSLDQIVDSAITNKVDAVFFAGDAYKDRNPLPQYQSEFAKRILKLEKEQIPTYLLIGNHDMSARTGTHALMEFKTFETKYIQVIDELTHWREETSSGEEYDLIALPWIHKSKLLIEEILDTLEMMVESLDPETPNIFLGHCSVKGAQYSTGQVATLGDDLMLPKSFLTENGFDYVALGHIHKPQQLSGDVPIIYPGSIERVNWGEAGEEKGFYIVELSDHSVSMENKSLDIRPFWDIQVKLENKATILQDISEKIPDDLGEQSRLPMLRIKLEYPEHWAGLINNQEIESLLPDVLSVQIIHEPIRKQRTRLALDKGISEYSGIELMRMYFEEAGVEDQEKEELINLGRNLMVREEVHEA